MACHESSRLRSSAAPPCAVETVHAERLIKYYPLRVGRTDGQTDERNVSKEAGNSLSVRSPWKGKKRDGAAGESRELSRHVAFGRRASSHPRRIVHVSAAPGVTCLRSNSDAPETRASCETRVRMRQRRDMTGPFSVLLAN